MTKRNTRVAFIKRTPSPPPQLTPATWRAISMEELKSFNEKRLEKARDAHDFVAACEFDSLQIRSESLGYLPVDRTLHGPTDIQSARVPTHRHMSVMYHG